MKIKKIASLLAVASLFSATTMTSFANEKATTSFTYENRNDPTYSISIPSSVVLNDEGSSIDFTVSDSKYLDGKKVSVTLDSTDQPHNQLTVQHTEKLNNLIRYQIINPEGEVFETVPGDDIINGKEILYFTKNGQKSCDLKIVKNSSMDYLPGTYAGTLTFNIGVVDR